MNPDAARIRKSVDALQPKIPPEVDMAKVRAAVETAARHAKVVRRPPALIFKKVAEDTALRGTMTRLNRGCSGFGHPSFLTGP